MGEFGEAKGEVFGGQGYTRISYVSLEHVKVAKCNWICGIEMNYTQPTWWPYTWNGWWDLAIHDNGSGANEVFGIGKGDITDQVDGRSLRNKTTIAMWKFLLEDVKCQYKCVGKIVPDMVNLNVNEAIDTLKD